MSVTGYFNSKFVGWEEDMNLGVEWNILWSQVTAPGILPGAANTNK